MPHKEPEDSRVVSVRLPNTLVQRLDRVLDWQTTHRRRPATRNAAMRDALYGWLDQQEQLAGLLAPQVLRQQFQAAYDSLHPPVRRSSSCSIPIADGKDSEDIFGSAAYLNPKGQGDTSLPTKPRAERRR